MIKIGLLVGYLLIGLYIFKKSDDFDDIIIEEELRAMNITDDIDRLTQFVYIFAGVVLTLGWPVFLIMWLIDTLKGIFNNGEY